MGIKLRIMHKTLGKTESIIGSGLTIVITHEYMSLIVGFCARCTNAMLGLYL